MKKILKISYFLVLLLIVYIMYSLNNGIREAEMHPQPHEPRVPYNWDDYEVPATNKTYHDNW